MAAQENPEHPRVTSCKLIFSHVDFGKVTIISPTGKKVFFKMDWGEWVNRELAAAVYRGYLAAQNKREPWEINVDLSDKAMTEAFYMAYPSKRPKPAGKAKKEKAPVIPPTDEEHKRALAVCRYLVPQGDGFYARKLSGDRWELSTTNDYPLQHGSGKRYEMTTKDVDFIFTNHKLKTT